MRLIVALALSKGKLIRRDNGMSRVFWVLYFTFLAFHAAASELESLLEKYQLQSEPNPDEIFSAFRPLLSNIDSAPTKTQVETFLLLADASFRQSRFEQTIDYTRRLELLFESSKIEPETLLQSLYLRGYSFESLGRMDAAEQTARRAIGIATHYNIIDARVRNIINLAAIYRLKHLYQDAILELEKVEQLMFHIDFQKLPQAIRFTQMGNLYAEQSNIYADINENEKAAALMEKALALSRKMEEDYNLKMDLYNLGQIYWQLKDLKKSKAMLQELVGLLGSGANNEDMSFLANNGLANIYLEENNLTATAAVLKINATLVNSVEAIDTRAAYYVISARLARRTSEFEKMRHFLFDFDQIFNQSQQGHRFDMRELRAQYWQARRDPKQASRQWRKLYQDYHAWAEKQQLTYVQNAKDKYQLQLESIRQQIKDGENKIQIMTLERNTEKIHGRYMLVSLGAAALLLVIFFHFSHRRRLKNMAERDYLTQVYNRRVVYDRGQRMMQNSRQGVSLVMIDLDHFKSLNDSYGHGFGDEVLALVAQAGSEIVRQNDVFGRVGGEEFLFVLMDSDVAAARAIAQRFGEKLLRLNYTEPVTVTASIGISISTSHFDDFQNVVNLADQALYHAKNNGRNRIEVFVAAA